MGNEKSGGTGTFADLGKFAPQAINALPPQDVAVLHNPGQSTMPAVKPNPAVTAIGGLTSDPSSTFFGEVDKVAPGAEHVWETGAGDQANIDRELDHRIAKAATNDYPTTFVGHSQGANLLYNSVGRTKPTNPNLSFLYVDPAKPGFWTGNNAVHRQLVPWLKETDRAVRGGIMSDPNTISWTGGNVLKQAHQPWKNTNDPANLQRVNDFMDKLKQRVNGQKP